MYPLVIVATNLVPSADEEIEFQYSLDVLVFPLASPPPFISFHVRPESTEVQIDPPKSTAANFKPSAEEVTDLQFVEGESLWFHVTPLSVEV